MATGTNDGDDVVPTRPGNWLFHAILIAHISACDARTVRRGWG